MEGVGNSGERCDRGLGKPLQPLVPVTGIGRRAKPSVEMTRRVRMLDDLYVLGPDLLAQLCYVHRDIGHRSSPASPSRECYRLGARHDLLNYLGRADDDRAFP